MSVRGSKQEITMRAEREEESRLRNSSAKNPRFSSLRPTTAVLNYTVEANRSLFSLALSHGTSCTVSFDRGEHKRNSEREKQNPFRLLYDG